MCEDLDIVAPSVREVQGFSVRRSIVPMTEELPKWRARDSRIAVSVERQNRGKVGVRTWKCGRVVHTAPKKLICGPVNVLLASYYGGK